MMDQFKKFSAEQAAAERLEATIKAIDQAKAVLQEKLSTAKSIDP